MIKIIPTNHLMSKEAIEGILKDESPEIIGIELCELRENIILNEIKQEPSKDKSLLGKISNSIKKKAEEKNLDYGSDMKAALRFAKENKIQYALVDMPILKTQELFGLIPKEEQEGFAKELIEFQTKEITTKVDEQEVLTTMKSRYPIAFEFLVNMRNLYIANQILITEKRNPGKKIVVILGSAHADNVTKLIGG